MFRAAILAVPIILLAWQCCHHCFLMHVRAISYSTCSMKHVSDYDYLSGFMSHCIELLYDIIYTKLVHLKCAG